MTSIGAPKLEARHRADRTRTDHLHHSTQQRRVASLLEPLLAEECRNERMGLACVHCLTPHYSNIGRGLLRSSVLPVNGLVSGCIEN